MRPFREFGAWEAVRLRSSTRAYANFAGFVGFQMTKFSVARRSQPIIDHFLAIFGTRPAKSDSLLDAVAAAFFAGDVGGVCEQMRQFESVHQSVDDGGVEDIASAEGVDQNGWAMRGGEDGLAVAR